MRASLALSIFFPPVVRAVAGRHYRRNYSLQRHLSLSQSSPIAADQAPDSLDSLELDEGSSFDGTGNTQPCSQGWSTPFDSSQRTSCDGGGEAEDAAVADEVDGGEAAVVPGEEEDLVDQGGAEPESQEFSFSPVQLPIPQSSPSTDSTSSTTNTSHTVQIFYADDAVELPACELRDVDPFQTTIADLERVLRENLMAKEPLIRIKLLESEGGVPVPGDDHIIRDVGWEMLKVRLLPKDETPLLRLEEAVTLPDFSSHPLPEKESQAFDHVGEEDSTEKARTQMQRVDVEQYLARVWETAADDETRGRLMNAHELYVSKQTKNALEAWRLSRAGGEGGGGRLSRGAEEQKAGN
eukprot:g14453.t1